MNLSWLFFAVAFLVGALISRDRQLLAGGRPAGRGDVRRTDPMALAADPCRYAVVGLGRRRARRRLRRRRGAPGARAWGSDAHVAGHHRSAHLLGRTRSFRLGGLHRTRGGHGADRGLFADARRVLLDRAPLKRAGYSTRWANSSPSFEGGWRVGGSARPSAGTVMTCAPSHT